MPERRLPGKQIWKYAYPTNYQDALGKGDGPRSTPADRRRQGRHARRRRDAAPASTLDEGKKLWSRSLTKEYKMPLGYFGIGTLSRSSSGTSSSSTSAVTRRASSPST